MIAPGERASPDEEPSTTNGDVASRAAVRPSPADPPGASGQQLLAEFIRYGRERPFEEIVRRYAGMVFNVCLRVTKDKHEAEDATQAVFLTLAVQAKRGAEIKALGPWLQQVAKRLSLDVRRGKKRRKAREERHHDDQVRRRTSADADGLPSPDLDELKTILHEELQKLPAKYRLPLVLHYFGGMTRDEMAAELDVKPATLGVRIFRAREMLAGRLNGRGVHLSAGAMAVAIGYLVKRTVTDAMVATTSHAAAAVAGGANLATVGDLMAAHAGSAAAAARVISLTRRASHVIVVGKVRLTVSLTMLALTSLGAGARALAMLPPLHMGDVQQLLTESVVRLVRPLVDPLTRPLRADAGEPGPAVMRAVPDAVPGPVVPPMPIVVAAAVDGGGVVRAVVAAAGTSGPVVPRAAVEGPTPCVAAVAVAADHAGVSAGPAAAAGADAAAAGRRSADVVRAAAAVTAPTLLASTDGGTALNSAGGMAASPADDLYVPAAGGGGSVYTLGGATGVQIVQVPAVGGSVTESNGVVRGYGRIDKTGTLSVSGKVVADGGGVDRTLDLTGFSAVTVATPSGPTATGWYAADHGRLSLPLVGSAAAPTPRETVGPVAAVTATGSPRVDTVAAAASDTTVLTWGADPTEAVLTPVNSVRLTIHGGPVPTGLSLLSPDRSDAPAVPAADGAPIGLWHVDGAPLSAVDLVVRYDDHLADELAGDESAVMLWTMDTPAGGWTSVDPSTFNLDVADHLASGSAQDVSYFAVTVPPAAGVDADQMVAHPAFDLFARPAGTADFSAATVPEPGTAAAVGLAALAGIGRRRRKIAGRRNPSEAAASVR